MGTTAMAALGVGGHHGRLRVGGPERRDDGLHPVAGRAGGIHLGGVQRRAVDAADHQNHRNAIAPGELARQSVGLWPNPRRWVPIAAPGPLPRLRPINNMKTIPSNAAPNPSCQERRPVTAAANPSHITMTSISVT